MTTAYPGALDTFRTDWSVGIKDLNDIRDALAAIQAELGTNPSAGSATLAARLDAIEAALAAVTPVNVADTFTRSDSTSSLGSTTTGSLAWSQWRGTWGIASNTAYVSNGHASGTCYAVINAGAANVTVSAKLTSTGGVPAAGIIVRGGASDTDFFLVEVGIGYAYTPKIYKVVGGSVTTPATGSSVTFASGDTLSVEVTSTAITAKQNGTTTLVSLTGESTHNTNTRAGMYVAGGTGSSPTARIDDFSVQS